MSLSYRIFSFLDYFNQMICINPTFFFFHLKRNFLLPKSNRSDGHHHWSSLLNAIATNNKFRNRYQKLRVIDSFWKEQRRRQRRQFMKLFVQREKRRADKWFKNKLKRCLFMCASVHMCFTAATSSLLPSSSSMRILLFHTTFFLSSCVQIKEKWV